jgi:hypothetical protein
MIKSIFTTVVCFLLSQGFSQNLSSELMTSPLIPIDGNNVEMIPFRVGAKYGFVAPNNPDQFIVEPIYSKVLAVHAEGAIVESFEERSAGLVNGNGESIISLEYDFLEKDGDLFHAVNYANEHSLYQYYHYFFSLNGELLFSQESKNNATFGTNSYAWFNYDGAIIVKDKNGFAVSRYPIEKRLFCLGIHNDYTCFRRGLRDTTYYSIYTHLGDLEYEIPVFAVRWYKGVLQLDDDLYMFESSKNNRLFTNNKGDLKPYRARLSNYELNESTIIERGSIRVGDVKAEAMGVINLKGDTIIPFEYAKIYSKVKNQYIAVEKNSGRMVLLDENGKKRSNIDLKSKFDFIQQIHVLSQAVGFYDGLAIARQPILKGDSLANQYIEAESTVFYFSYFNEKGEIVIRLDPKYTFAGNFSEGLAAVADSDGNLGFINSTGEWVIPPDFKLNTPAYGRYEPHEIPHFKGGYAYIHSANGYIDKQGREYYKD